MLAVISEQLLLSLQFTKMLFPSIFITLLLVAWQQNFVAGQVHFKKGAPHVKLPNGGLISGVVKFSRDGRPYNSFVGIPYVKVPERFQEPVPITEASWDGVLDATKPGARCTQSQFPSPNIGEITFGDEDCLNLNVYVPMNNTGSGKNGYPVMVWIHGGGFMFGGGFEYGPRYFMEESVILVTINYRVGVFGFLSTGDSVIPGNNGMKDMVVALKWVQDNIKSFGGDPGAVTVFGESGGGAAVHHLYLSPVTKGLFHRAISMSGNALNMWAYDPRPRDTAVELATFVKCQTTAETPEGISSEEILSCFKGLTAEELNKAQFKFRTSWPSNMKNFYFAPTVEPVDPVSSLTPFQTEPPISILSRKNSNLPDIPLMIGATEDEGAPMYAGVILENPDRSKEMNEDWENIAPTFDYDEYLGKEEQKIVTQKLKDFYFGDKEISDETRVALSNFFSDQSFLHGAYKSAFETASRGKRNQVYLYQYAYKGPMSLMGVTFQLKGETTKKVGHGDDLPLLFDFSETIPGAEHLIRRDSPDEEFSKNLVKLWASFAIHGEPKHSWGNASTNRWKAISKKEIEGGHPMRWFRIDSNPSEQAIDQGVKDRMRFWDDLWSEYLTPAVLEIYKSSTNKEAGARGKSEL